MLLNEIREMSGLPILENTGDFSLELGEKYEDLAKQIVIIRTTNPQNIGNFIHAINRLNVSGGGDLDDDQIDEIANYIVANSLSEQEIVKLLKKTIKIKYPLEIEKRELNQWFGSAVHRTRDQKIKKYNTRI